MHFYSEIQVLAKVKNPAVLSLIGFNLQNFSKEDYPTIILEYMPNGTLNSVLKEDRKGEHPPKLTNTKKYINLLGIAIGMQYLHSIKIIHRDLKPDNILLDYNFYPFISDFNVSKIIEGSLSRNLMNSGVGTILYMAPEILKGDNYNYKVDVYSYSMIAYELITGQSQQIQGGIFKIMQNVIDGKRPDCSKIKNKKIKTFLEACWSGNPDQRPNFDQILKTICDIDFCSAFSVNFKEVQNYLLRFPSDNKILNKFIMQLSNDKLKNIPPGTEFKVINN